MSVEVTFNLESKSYMDHRNCSFKVDQNLLNSETKFVRIVNESCVQWAVFEIDMDGVTIQPPISSHDPSPIHDDPVIARDHRIKELTKCIWDYQKWAAYVEGNRKNELESVIGPNLVSQLTQCRRNSLHLLGEIALKEFHNEGESDQMEIHP